MPDLPDISAPPVFTPVVQPAITEGVPLKVVSDFDPSGDQPDAIKGLVTGLLEEEKDQVLLGVTGSGKTFTIAHTIQTVDRPALVLAPNKTLAAQLYGEMKEFFPENSVEYFVSYYDYYQPEAYVPRTDTYIEKDASINEQIDRMRHSATRALLERKDVVIVASVSCIYGIGGVETGASPAGSVTARVKTRPRLVRASLRVTSAFRRPSAAMAHLDARGPTPTLFSSAVNGAGADRAAARRAVDGLHDPDAVETAAGAARADIAIPPVSPRPDRGRGTFASSRTTGPPVAAVFAFARVRGARG